MLVVCQDFELLPEQARLDGHGGTIGPGRQGWRNVEFDVVHGQLLVRAEVFAFEIGVDRHLQRAASTDGRDEVDGHDPALLTNELDGFRGDIKVHTIANTRQSRITPGGSMVSLFRRMHAEGGFVMPNPWDRGSARVLEELGFQALATTSAGFGRAIGKKDQEVTRDELVAHVADLASFIAVPLNVDSEQMFPHDPGGVERTVQLLVDAGAAGISVEDFDPQIGSIEPIEVATERVARVCAAAGPSGVVVTARAENYLYGQEDLEDTLERLIRYRLAGADVLYAPGLTVPADIGRVVREAGAPVNVLAMTGGPSISELFDLGVRRISAGSALYNEAYGTLRTAAGRLDPRVRMA